MLGFCCRISVLKQVTEIPIAPIDAAQSEPSSLISNSILFTLALTRFLQITVLLMNVECRPLSMRCVDKSTASRQVAHNDGIRSQNVLAECAEHSSYVSERQAVVREHSLNLTHHSPFSQVPAPPDSGWARPDPVSAKHP